MDILLLIVPRQCTLQFSGITDRNLCSYLSSRKTGVQISRKENVTQPIFQINHQHHGNVVCVEHKLQKVLII